MAQIGRDDDQGFVAAPQGIENLGDAFRRRLANNQRHQGEIIQRALQEPLAEMILAGDVLDGDLIPVSAGSEGLIIGDRVAASNRPKPHEATVH